MTCYSLDVFYNILHIVVIFFNLFGWIIKRTRLWHFYLINITAFSWVILGFWYGFGYCFLTDWHWDVKESCGERDLPNNYIAYFLKEYLNITFSEFIVDLITAICFVSVFFLSWIFFIKFNGHLSVGVVTHFT